MALMYQDKVVADVGGGGALPVPGPPGPAGSQGAPGEDGATFTPSVSEDGTLSWSNDKGLPNPEPVNIQGPPGEQGAGSNDEFSISFDERKVGVYTNADGKSKPIYRRTFSLTSPLAAVTWTEIVPESEVHIDLIISTSGQLETGQLNGINIAADCNGGEFYFASELGALKMLARAAMTNRPVTLTLEWTKTTDEWTEYAEDQEGPIIGDGGSQAGTPVTNSNIYSLEERRIGTWIDGKPLYRLSIETTVENPGTASAILELPAEAEVKMFQGFAKRVDNGAIYSLPNTEPNDVGHNISCYIHNSKIMVWAGSGVATRLKNGKFWAIAEYTKTTDEAQEEV